LFQGRLCQAFLRSHGWVERLPRMDCCGEAGHSFDGESVPRFSIRRSPAISGNSRLMRVA
jgi:hypothetical protein